MGARPRCWEESRCGGYFESQVRDVFRHSNLIGALQTKFVGICMYATSGLK